MSHKVYAIISHPDLENMYTLLKPIHGGLGLLVEEVEMHIKATALDAVKRLKGDNASLYVFFKYKFFSCSGKWREFNVYVWYLIASDKV